MKLVKLYDGKTVLVYSYFPRLMWPQQEAMVKEVMTDFPKLEAGKIEIVTVYPDGITALTFDIDRSEVPDSYERNRLPLYG